MTEKSPGASKGLLDSLTAFAATLIAIAHTRLDILSADMEEEREHLFMLQVLILASLFCLGIGIVLATTLLVVAFWDTNRFLVLALLAGFFLVAGVSAGWFAIYKARTKPRLFAASLLELVKDQQQLVSRP